MSESDPYDTPEERAECHDVITFLFSWSGENGLFSTWRERHIAIRGGAAGLRAPQLSQVPECPDMWKDEGQYWDGCGMICNVAKIYGSASIATMMGALIALKNAGVI